MESLGESQNALIKVHVSDRWQRWNIAKVIYNRSKRINEFG